jgi:TPR repeat protein
MIPAMPYFIFIALLLLTAPAFAGFAEGKAAYDRKDWRVAIENLRPAAEAGDDRAMIVLGNMYANGMGVTWDMNEALALYARAAAKGNAQAMLANGAIYVNGDGVEKSFVTAADWFRKAAETGNQTGAFFYAMLVLRGNKSPDDDLKSDPYTAYKWFKIASLQKTDLETQKNATAMAQSIASKLLSPEKVSQADAEALAWKPL